MPGKLALQNALDKPYNRIAFVQDVLSSVFDGRLTAYSPAMPRIGLTDTEQRLIQSVAHYADLRLDDGTDVPCFEILLQPQVRIEQSRVGIQQYVRKLLTAGQAVLVNFVPAAPNGQPDPGQPWRLTLVAKDTALIDGEIKDRPTHAKRYTYLLGPGQACRTPAERLVKLFEQTTLDFATLVQTFEVEALSKAFFKEYKRHYEAVNTYLTGSAFRASVFNGDEKTIRDWSKKLLGRVVFLYFVQKKGWLGASTTAYQDGNTRYTINFLTDLFQQAGANDAFYPNWLSKLFFETLNQPRTLDNFTLPDGRVVKVPFLNGGLFDRDAPDRKGPIPLPARLFHNEQNPDDPALRGFLDFLNSYNFTVHEDSPDDHTVAVDPEMLGNIFENLLEDNKDKGAFYTPRAIVHYMCQESLIEYLDTALNQPGHRANLADFVITKLLNAFVTQQAGAIDALLDRVKICDPAIGSGAFPMGLLQEIYQCKLALMDSTTPNPLKGTTPGETHAQIKLNIIQNSIYGVDIERGAVDIARLRFWLSLVVDEERPRALPNLDYKIVVGNSLVSKLDNEILTLDWTLRGFADAEKEIVRLTKSLGQKQRAFFSASGDKATAQRDIRDLKIDLLLAQINLDRAKVLANMPGTGLFDLPAKDQKKRMALQTQVQGLDASLRQLRAIRQDPAKPLPYFDWRLDFPEVLNPHVAEQIGFDIVIGNPPYLRVRSEDISERVSYQNIYNVAINQFDLYHLFIEKSKQLTKSQSSVTMIVPNAFLANENCRSLRGFILDNYSIKQIVEIKDQIFDEASVEVVVFIFGPQGISYESTYLESNRGIFKLKNIFDYQSFRIDRNLNFTVTLNTDALSLISSIDKQSDLLELHFDTVTGIKEYQVGKGQPAQTSYEVTNRVFNANKKISDTFLPELRGRNVQRYIVVWQSEYINYGPWLAEPRQKRYFSGEKLLIRQIPGAQSLIVAYTTEDYIVDQTAYVAKLKSESLLTYQATLALLNSKLIFWYFQNTNNEFDLLFPKIKTKEFRRLPVYKFANTLQQQTFVSLVTQILDAKRVNPAADTAALEAKIDLQVYHLYNLTHAEVLLIDPAFALSEAEYQAAGEKMAVS